MTKNKTGQNWFDAYFWKASENQRIEKPKTADFSQKYVRKSRFFFMNLKIILSETVWEAFLKHRIYSKTAIFKQKMACAKPKTVIFKEFPPFK